MLSSNVSGVTVVGGFHGGIPRFGAVARQFELASSDSVRIVSSVMSEIRARTISAKVMATEVFMDGLRPRLLCCHRLRPAFAVSHH